MCYIGSVRRQKKKKAENRISSKERGKCIFFKTSDFAKQTNKQAALFFLFFFLRLYSKPKQQLRINVRIPDNSTFLINFHACFAFFFLY